MANGRNPGAARAAARSKIKVYESRAVKVTMEGDIAGAIRMLSKEFQTEVIRPATYAAARIIYEQMRRNVPIDSGELRNAIYHWFDDKQSTPTRSIYMIGPNKVKAPHWHHVEYGHWRYNKIVNGRFQKSKDGGKVRINSNTIPFTITDDWKRVHKLDGALSAPKWVPGQPYIRVTFDQNIGRALEASKKRAAEKIREVIAEIAQ